MSNTPAVSMVLRVERGATPESHFNESSKIYNGFLVLAGSEDAPALYLPSKAPDAVAYLDALIRAACDLRNHYVEWAKTHDVALAA